MSETERMRIRLFAVHSTKIMMNIRNIFESCNWSQSIRAFDFVEKTKRRWKKKRKMKRVFETCAWNDKIEQSKKRANTFLSFRTVILSKRANEATSTRTRSIHVFLIFGLLLTWMIISLDVQRKCSLFFSCEKASLLKSI